MAAPVLRLKPSPQSFELHRLLPEFCAIPTCRVLTGNGHATGVPRVKHLRHSPGELRPLNVTEGCKPLRQPMRIAGTVADTLPVGRKCGSSLLSVAA